MNPACTCYRRNRPVAGLGKCGDEEVGRDVLDEGCEAKDFEDAEDYVEGVCGSGSVRGRNGRGGGFSSEDISVSSTASAGETTMLETTSTSGHDAGWTAEETMTTTTSLQPTPASSDSMNAAVSLRTGGEASEATTEAGSQSRAHNSALASTSETKITPTSSALPPQTHTSARRLSPSAKIALAAGIPCGALFLVIFCASVRLVSKRRNVTKVKEITRSQTRPNKDGEKGLERELDGFDTSRHEMETDGNRAELHVSVERHEMATNGNRIELHVAVARHEMETHANRAELHGAVECYELDGRELLKDG